MEPGKKSQSAKPGGTIDGWGGRGQGKDHTRTCLPTPLSFGREFLPTGFHVLSSYRGMANAGRSAGALALAPASPIKYVVSRGASRMHFQSASEPPRGVRRLRRQRRYLPRGKREEQCEIPTVEFHEFPPWKPSKPYSRYTAKSKCLRCRLRPKTLKRPFFAAALEIA